MICIILSIMLLIAILITLYFSNLLLLYTYKNIAQMLLYFSLHANSNTCTTTFFTFASGLTTILHTIINV